MVNLKRDDRAPSSSTMLFLVHLSTGVPLADTEKHPCRIPNLLVDLNRLGFCLVIAAHFTAIT
jgi:hypothetical protein